MLMHEDNRIPYLPSKTVELSTHERPGMVLT
jgi:hypothetical protein